MCAILRRSLDRGCTLACLRASCFSFIRLAYYLIARDKLIKIQSKTYDCELMKEFKSQARLHIKIVNQSWKLTSMIISDLWLRDEDDKKKLKVYIRQSGSVRIQHDKIRIFSHNDHWDDESWSTKDCADNLLKEDILLCGRESTAEALRSLSRGIAKMRLRIWIL